MGVGYEAVLAWIRNGELAAFNAATKQGGMARYRVAESSLQAFLERRKVAAEGPMPRRQSVCPAASAPGVERFFPNL